MTLGMLQAFAHSTQQAGPRYQREVAESCSNLAKRFGSPGLDGLWLQWQWEAFACRELELDIQHLIDEVQSVHGRMSLVAVNKCSLSSLALVLFTCVSHKFSADVLHRELIYRVIFLDTGVIG